MRQLATWLQFAGTIEMKEMVEIIGTLYEMEGLQKVTFWWKVQSMLLWVFQDGAASRAEAIFGILDFNGIIWIQFSKMST